MSDMAQGSTSKSDKLEKPLAIAIMGPTASGKTDLSIALAQQFDTELISVDSALVYKGLNIGSAKPSIGEQKLVKHHLIDICSPEQSYSAADFVRDSKAIIADLVAKNKTPILVGGTMLYFKALLEGLSKMPPASAKIRTEIEGRAQKYGWQSIYDELKKVDPVSAQRIHPNHSQRLSRALEVFLSSGKPMSQWQQGGEGGLLNSFNWCQIAIAPRDRSFLHKRIEERFDLMLNQGLVKEVQFLRMNPNLHLDLPSMRAVGYRQVWEYLDGKCSIETMREKGIVSTRQLAKRQLTWLRGWEGLSWLDILDKSGNLKVFDEIVKNALNFLPETNL